MERFSWLHLTDLHFGLKGQGSLWPNLREPFFEDLERRHERTGPWNAVLFTGDLAQSGKSAEYRDMASEVLDRLWGKLAEWGSAGAALVAVPGNHDLHRPGPDDDNPAMDTLLRPGGFDGIAPKFWGNPKSTYRQAVVERFAAYSEWWERTPYRAKVRAGMLPGDLVCTLNAGERRVGVMGLNTAWLQLGGGDYKGRLIWDARQVAALCPSGVDDWVSEHDLCLLLTHHGPDWLSPDARKHGASEIAPAGRFAAHLFGHMHEHAAVWTRVGASQRVTRLVQGASVFGMERWGDPHRPRGVEHAHQLRQQRAGHGH